MKRVSDTSAGKSIAAWVIFKGAREVAKVQAHFGNSGTVSVDVLQGFDAAERCALAMNSTKIKGLKGISDTATWRDLTRQWGKASGYGYDKLTAALAGLYIDGHALTDHCHSRDKALKPPRGRKTWPRDAKPKRGYSFANFATLLDGKRPFSPEEKAEAQRLADEGSDRIERGYTDCYRVSGLDYLKELGYTVAQAI